MKAKALWIARGALFLAALVAIGLGLAEAVECKIWIPDPRPGEVWVERDFESKRNPYRPSPIIKVSVVSLLNGWVEYMLPDGRKIETSVKAFKWVYCRLGRDEG